MLQDFLSKLNKDGFTMSKPYLFLVRFGDGDTARDMSMLCHSATLPTLNLQTVPNRIYGYSVNMLSDVEFSPVSLHFYIDSQWEVVKKLEGIRDKMVNRVNYSPKFHEDYEFTVDIVILDSSNTDAQIAEYKMNGCILRGYQVQELSWAAVNTIQQVSVELTYSTYDVTFKSTTKEPLNPSPKGAMNNLIGKLSQDISSAMNFDTVKQMTPDIAQYFNIGKEVTPSLTEGQTTLSSTSFPRIIG